MHAVDCDLDEDCSCGAQATDVMPPARLEEHARVLFGDLVLPACERCGTRLGADGATLTPHWLHVTSRGEVTAWCDGCVVAREVLQ